LVDAATFVVPLACLFASLPPALAADAERNADQRPAIRIVNGGARFEVVGLPPAALASLRATPPTTADWNRLLTVTIGGGKNPPSAPMLGKYAVTETAIVFTPRFPLRPGLEYRAVFDPPALSGNLLLGAERIEATLKLPAPPAGPSTTVSGVFPSSDVLPANLLKFYIHFSAPMTRGDSYRHIRIVDDDANEVPDSFLRLPEELWNADGTRLTLLFDPGRIKRGLKPNEDLGAPLVEGRRYALVIDAAWPDARRTPLRKEFRKPFRVTAPDYAQPNPRHWKITPPQRGARAPLTVSFDEPLDDSLLQHMLAVHDDDNEPVAGRITTSHEETMWHFHPKAPWRPGDYRLVVEAELEDRAGNSIGRAFEIRDSAHPESDAPSVLRFTVAP
jgi:hypothetical protein